MENLHNWFVRAGQYCSDQIDRQVSDQKSQSTFQQNKQDMRTKENSLSSSEGRRGDFKYTRKGVRRIGEKHEGDSGSDRQRLQDRTQNLNKQARQTDAYITWAIHLNSLSYFAVKCKSSQIQHPVFIQHAQNCCHSALQHITSFSGTCGECNGTQHPLHTELEVCQTICCGVPILTREPLEVIWYHSKYPNLGCFQPSFEGSFEKSPLVKLQPAFPQHSELISQLAVSCSADTCALLLCSVVPLILQTAQHSL